MSEVLKSCGIDSHHKQFRPFLQQLFKVCSKQWLQQSCIESKTSTSEAMRALVMKHKSTVLKLKSTSPKNDSKSKNNVVSKQKSVADVKKVLFTDKTPKSFKFEKFGSDLNTKASPVKKIVISDSIDDSAVHLDLVKLHSNKNTEDQSVSSTSDYFSNSDIDSKNTETISIS